MSLADTPVAASIEWLNFWEAVRHLPLITTVFCAVFCLQLLARYRLRRNGAHLLWWAAGAFAFGVGTTLESIITLSSNSVLLNKCWYIAGALCGGYPLAQGSVFLLLKRRTALILTAVSLPLVLILSGLVVMSPVVEDALQPHRPSGDILEWRWIRAMTPVINLYAAGFLVGGAIISAVRYRKAREPGDGTRATGNALIALGALLPGIGGAMAKAGAVEALYVAELVGIVMIWMGYMVCIRAPSAPAETAVT